jgi:hypothetical protein
MKGVSFVQHTKLTNVAGRIRYISSEEEQEYLYAVYDTAPEGFWQDLARENQMDFRRSGTTGKCIEAREGGATRYETNIEILKEAAKFSNDNSEILVCSGQNFPDSLSAAATGKPILLVKNALQDGQKTYLKSLGGSMTFTVIGGTGAVSDSVKNELNAYGKTDRVWGLTRYETSTAVAKKYFKNPEQGVIAYGVNFPDGLCGGVLAYNMDAPLLLAANGKTDAAVKYAGESGTTLGAVLGGPTLVSDASVRAILHMDKDSEIIVR